MAEGKESRKAARRAANIAYNKANPPVPGWKSKDDKAAEKAAKAAPAPKAEPKAKAKAAPKPKPSSPRPKAKPGPMNNAAGRPEGKAAGMPAAKKKPVVDAGTAAVGAAAIAAAHGARVAGNIVSGGRNKPTPKTGTAVTSPKPTSVTRFGAGRGAGAGGLRRLTGGGGRLNKIDDMLMFPKMAKGGLVKKD